MNTSLTGRVEAVQRKALNVVDWRFRSPTSSGHPYRPFATSMRRARNLNFSGIDSSIATRALTGSPASLPPTAAALLPLHVASFAW